MTNSMVVKLETVAKIVRCKKEFMELDNLHFVFEISNYQIN